MSALLMCYITNDSLYEPNSQSDIADQTCYACSDWGRGVVSCEEEERRKAAEEKKPQEEMLA